MSDSTTEAPGSERSASPVIIWASRFLAVLYMLGGLPGIIYFRRSLGFARDMSWESAADVAIASYMLCVCPALFLAGLGLLLKREWGRVLTAAVPGLVVVLMIIVASLDRTFETIVFIPVVGALFAAVFFATSRPSLAEATGAKTPRPAAFGRFVAAAVFALMVASFATGYVVWEVPKIGEQVRVAGWDRACENTEDPEACGHASLHRLRESDSPEDWARGYAGLKALCDRGVGAGCRRFALSHDPWYLANYPGGIAQLEHVRAELATTCVDAPDARACFAYTVFRDVIQKKPPGYSEDDDVGSTARELCEAGDPWACRATEELDYDAEYPVELCRAGFARGCQALEDDLDDAGRRKVLTQACSEHPGMLGCANVGPPESAKRHCEAGLLESCKRAPEWVAEDAPYASLQLAVYEAMATRQPRVAWDIGAWFLVGFEHPDLERACEADVGIACFGLGLTHSAEQKGELVPKLDDELEQRYSESFGRACELGVDVGCFALAERLNNRAFGQAPHPRRDQPLVAACERRNRQACWLKPVADDLAAGDYATYGQMAATACRAQWGWVLSDSPCNELAYFWAHEVGATTWLMSGKLQTELSGRGCLSTSDAWSCAARGYDRPRGGERAVDSTAEPWAATIFTALKTACQKGHSGSCSTMLRFVADEHPNGGERQANELKQRMCGALPDHEVCN